MQTEIEVKFLHLSHDEVRAKLQKLGATLEIPMRLMRRTLLDYPDKRLQEQNWGRLRVRDEGDRVTLTYKFGDNSNYSQEVETTVGSYKTTVQLFKEIGLQTFTEQESKRETWLLGEVEIVLDEWPFLDTYIEIEGKSEKAIKDCAVKLELNWKNKFLGNVDTAYRDQYTNMKADETIGAIAKLTFDSPLPDWLKDRLPT